MTQEKINLSKRALLKALELKAENSHWGGCSLRVYIEGKGCDGFYYGVSFDEVKSGDIVFPQIDEGLAIDLLIDPESLKFMKGSHVDWVDDERGAGFLVENPNHNKFRGKFFRRKDWQQKLGPSS